MEMYKTLGLNPKNKYMITFVGGGGKTSLMFSLAYNLKQFGSVLVTTTTRIRFEGENRYDNLVMLDKNKEDLFKPKKGITLLGNGIESGKVVGVSKELLDDLYDKNLYNFILIEADGAKEKPIKACKEGEPIIPLKTNINIGVIGVEALDKTVDEICFRKDIFKDITGYNLENVIDNNCIINLINHNKGLFKETPENCKKFFVVNKCDNEITQKRAKDLLRKVMKLTNISRVFLSSTYENIFLREYFNISGIVMASGLSRRMGQNKLLMNVNKKPMVENIVQQCTLSHLKNVLVVYSKEEVKNIVKDYDVTFCYNSQPEIGQSESIKIGVKKSSEDNVDGYMFLVSDQPFLKSETINKLLSNFENNIVIPVYNGKKSSPVTFPSSLKEKFLLLENDNGGREIIKQCENIIKVEIDSSTEGIDIDTLEEYEAIGRERNE